ncbi:hypothetical protein F0L68_28555 [Solihabitans fulvus]|uniref:Butirosin biosynthesis protein H, N-terminal n=1 Tax=Solihabitans fulvus TaxID=1892852 RepID=A0A5B2WWW2_9PSEU|nr:hypothetical protein [Solihabitans fulvus]KAA2255360.1 hypothetical protein F0L68_28555 [Solihabitans fulvus]
MEFTGLSCYTANLVAYLAEDDPGAAARFADSVRLAVRVDLPDGALSFSHHDIPLDRLPDGTRLRYACAVDAMAARDEVEAELAAHGQVLVVTDNARLPWSPSFGTISTAPHWLLVDGRDGDQWHVVDHFAGLLPTGEQSAHTGTLSTARLLDAMTLPRHWSAVQQRRSELAFGFPVGTPLSGPQWLRRDRDDGRADELPGRWLTTDAEALPFLADRFRADPIGMAPYLDDLWTVAGHHTFRYRRLREDPACADDARAALDGALDAWRQLPSALRFAVDSARRDRPRASLVDLTFGNLLTIESGQDALLPTAGRTAR